MTQTTCDHCGYPVDAKSRYTWHKISGYERPGKNGGSDITLRERTGTGWLHDRCVQDRKAGVVAGQESLV